MTAMGRASGEWPGGADRAFGNELFADLPPTRRHSLHRAAAEALSGDSVWLHRVAAATSVDESLAEALERAALAAAPRGAGRPGPAQLLQWASDLSGDQAGRERRLLTAAIHRICAEEPGPAGLWRRVEACPPSALRSCALSGRALAQGRPLEAEHHLDLAQAQLAGSPGSAVTAITHGLRAALLRDAALGQPAADNAMAGLAACGSDRGLTRWLTRLLAAGRCYADGPWAALDTLAGSDDPGHAGADRREHATLLALGCYRLLCGRLTSAIADLSELLGTPDYPLPPEMQVQGRLWLALACQLAGAWREADHHAKSAVDTVTATGARAGGTPHAISAMLAAYRGELAVAEEQLRHARDRADALRPDEAVLTDLAEATLAHSRAALDCQHPALRRLATSAAAGKYRALWLPLLAETLVEHGSEPEASAALTELLTLADRVPYLRLTWCRLSGRHQERRRDPVAARRHYEAARELPPECFGVPVQAGLIEHCHGRLLCELGSGDEGSALVDQAVARLTSAGAMPYARRAAADLAARRRAQEARPHDPLLTKREHAVARLVAAGLTNQEAAARLYVSVKTVEYHLAQIYGKLGITSRRQLARFALEPDQQP